MAPDERRLVEPGTVAVGTAVFSRDGLFAQLPWVGHYLPRARHEIPCTEPVGELIGHIASPALAALDHNLVAPRLDRGGKSRVGSHLAHPARKKSGQQGGKLVVHLHAAPGQAARCERHRVVAMMIFGELAVAVSEIIPVEISRKALGVSGAVRSLRLPFYQIIAWRQRVSRGCGAGDVETVCHRFGRVRQIHLISGVSHITLRPAQPVGHIPQRYFCKSTQ